MLNKTRSKTNLLQIWFLKASSEKISLKRTYKKNFSREIFQDISGLSARNLELNLTPKSHAIGSKYENYSQTV